MEKLLAGELRPEDFKKEKQLNIDPEQLMKALEGEIDLDKEVDKMKQDEEKSEAKYVDLANESEVTFSGDDGLMD